jgi:twinkle protein
VICEGEWDALVAIGLGYRAVSVPNGASGGEGELTYLWDARDLLNRVDSFVLATDSDEAGVKLRANLVAHLGADRCSFVEYGADCKDLNETLLRYGQEAARHVLDEAKPFPVKGLYTIDDFPERPELTVWPTGIDPLNDTGDHTRPALSIITGTLTVLTGHANAGKSTLIDSLVASNLRRGIPTCLASFETDVKPILLNDLRRTMLGIAQHELGNADTSACDRVIREKLHIISQSVEEDEEMNLEYFLDLCRTSVLRRGTRVIILDPWNELEHKMRHGENETVYIGRALRAIKRFAKVYDVAFWIVAHPTKPFEGKVRMPRLLDISGSANWANKADFGLSYHRGEHSADLCVTKVRKGYPGRRGNVKVNYDWRISAFVEAA